MLRAAFAFLLLMTAPAMTFDQAFLGTWAPEAASCANAGSTVRYTVTAEKLEGRETACTLKRASAVGPDWRMQYSCVGEGDTCPPDLKWHLTANGHLLEQAQGKTKEYVRYGQAKPADAATTAAADDFAGKYAGSQETYEWNAVITPKGGQSYSVHIAVSSSKWHCISELDAVGRLQAGRIIARPDEGDSCTLTISRSGGGIAVVEQGCALAHSATCTFNSRLKKVRQ